MKPHFDSDLVRQACLLEHHKRSPLGIPLVPMGLCGWEVQLSPQLWPLAQSLIPKGERGLDLFCATWDFCYVHLGRRWSRPWPTTPIFVRLTPTSLRVLYRCAVVEAGPVGQRLALLAARSLGKCAVRECSPAALVDLIRGYLRSDRKTQALLGADDVEVREQYLASWAVPWPADLVLTDLRGDALDPAELAGLQFGGVPAASQPPPASLPSVQQAYREGNPTCLTPVALYFDTRRTGGKTLDATLIRKLIHDSPYMYLPMGMRSGIVELLAPLRQDNHRAHLTHLRDEVARRLGTPAGYLTFFQETLLTLIDGVYSRFATLFGSKEVQSAPLLGPRAAVARDSARDLLARIAAATGAPVHLDGRLLSAVPDDAAAASPA